MIKSCSTCGGLYATDNLESFAGTPCRCRTSRELSLETTTEESPSPASDSKSSESASTLVTVDEAARRAAEKIGIKIAPHLSCEVSLIAFEKGFAEIITTELSVHQPDVQQIEWLKKVYNMGVSEGSVVPQRNAGELLARLDELGFGKQEPRRGNTLWAMVMDAADEVERLRGTGSTPDVQAADLLVDARDIIKKLLLTQAGSSCSPGYIYELYAKGHEINLAREVLTRLTAALARAADVQAGDVEGEK